MAQLFERQFKTAPKMGQREELADLISLVDAKDTPFTSMAKKGSQPKNTYFRWQVDSLPNPRLGGTVDGTDVNLSSDIENYTRDTVGGQTVTYRQEIAAYIQIFRRSVRVSPLTEDINNVAGVKSELARQISRAVQMIKRDMEITFCSDQGCQPDEGAGHPYLTRGLGKWLAARGATAANIAGGASEDPATYGTVAQDTEEAIPTQWQTPTENRLYKASSALTEADIQNVLTGIYKQSGQTRTFDALVGPALKRAFTNLVFNTPSTGGTQTVQAVRTLNREAKESTYTSSVDVFEGDFGKIRLHPSQWLKWNGTAGNDHVGYIIPFEHVEVRYGGNVAGVRELTNNGGGEARMVEAIAALVVHNPLAFGVLDLTA